MTPLALTTAVTVEGVPAPPPNVTTGGLAGLYPEPPLVMGIAETWPPVIVGVPRTAGTSGVGAGTNAADGAAVNPVVGSPVNPVMTPAALTTAVTVDGKPE